MFLVLFRVSKLKKTMLDQKRESYMIQVRTFYLQENSKIKKSDNYFSRF